MKLNEIEKAELPFVCVHARKGTCNVTAKTSYDAVKKAAEKWKLKSTAGIDAHRADVKKIATESRVVEGAGIPYNVEVKVYGSKIITVDAVTSREADREARALGYDVIRVWPQE